MSQDPRARILRGTCSPIWNGIGSDKTLTFNILLIVGHQATLRRSILPERSNLFWSHWSNQWLTQFSYFNKNRRFYRAAGDRSRGQLLRLPGRFHAKSPTSPESGQREHPWLRH